MYIIKGFLYFIGYLGCNFLYNYIHVMVVVRSQNLWTFFFGGGEVVSSKS